MVVHIDKIFSIHNFFQKVFLLFCIQWFQTAFCLSGAAGSPKLPQAGKRKALAAVDSVFNKFDEEEAEEAPKKRKLVPLDYSEDERGGLGLDGAEVTGSRPGVNTEEKRKHIKSLIEKIPTDKQELFNYPLDWNMVDMVREKLLDKLLV